MHNLYAIFAKFSDICKLFARNLTNKPRNFGNPLEILRTGLCSCRPWVFSNKKDPIQRQIPIYLCH
ncbi:hypothetical protein EVA_14847 [gut metagenome]|uniref:Uncharacterized protein n=1 Tax=gut metagenome TaxID=749906 RepID=J9G5J4_9ZZZZ